MKNNRPSLDKTFIDIAFIWSKRSTCSSRAAVGAVLVNKSNQIIASGYNGSPRSIEHCDDVGCILDSDNHCIRAIHAEQNVILHCASNGISSLGSSLYVTHSPCPRCCLSIIQAGITNVVYVHAYGSRQIESILLLEKAGVKVYQYISEAAWLDN